MHRIRQIIPLLCLAFLTLPLQAQNFETTEVADGVYKFRWNNHNAMFVASGNAVLAFDPISMEAAAAYAEEIKRVVPGAQLAGIVYSHSDADHATGAPALMAAFGNPGIPIIAHERAVQPIRARGDANLPEPNVTFAKRLSFDIGDRKIDLYYVGQSHTDNIAIGYVPDAGVAFAVDFVNHDRVGYRDLPSWIFPDFFDAMAGMLRIPFQTVIFGHGPEGDRGSIQRQIAYYDDLKSAVQQAVDAGLSEDEMAEQISLPAYAHFGQYEAWMPLNARAIYRWLAGD